MKSELPDASPSRPRPIEKRRFRKGMLILVVTVLSLSAWWLGRNSDKNAEGYLVAKDGLWILHDALLPDPLAIDPMDWSNRRGPFPFFNNPDQQAPDNMPSGKGGLDHFTLHLVWPSLHMPKDTPLCATLPAGTPLKSVAQLCPSMQTLLRADPIKESASSDRNGLVSVLRDDGLTFKRRWLGQNEPQLDDNQQQVDFEQRRVIQWSAFYTRGRDFLGWRCDRETLDRKAEHVGAWGSDRDLWAVPPSALKRQTCLEPTQWSLLRPALLGGMRQHVVLWDCPQPIETRTSWSDSEQSCTAKWIWNNHIMELTFVSEPAIRDRQPMPISYGSPASAFTAHLRPRMIEAAWRALEQGLRGQPTPDAPTANARLEQELAWCAQIQEAVLKVPEGSRGNPLDDELRDVSSRQEYETDRANRPASACNRALHRVVDRIVDLPLQGKVPDDLIRQLEQLATITRNAAGNISMPLLEAGRMVLERQHGEDSLAVLQWLSRRDYYQNPETVRDMLSRYQRLASELDQLPPRQRLLVRMPLASALTHQQAFNNAPYLEILPEIYFRGVEDWRKAPANTLTAIEEVNLLTHAALYSQQLEQPLPPDGSDGAAMSLPLSGAAASRMAELLPLMEGKSRRLLQDKGLSREERIILASRLAVHAAWTANMLAASSAEWQAWLVGWADWANAAFSPEAALMDEEEMRNADYPGQNPDSLSPSQRAAVTIKAITAHRDAAALRQASQPDCPGGPWLDCRP